MQRRIDDSRLQRVWVERIVWNVAAAAALATMIAILLCSLQWLDEIDPEAGRDRARLELDHDTENRPTRIAGVDGARS